TRILFRAFSLPSRRNRKVDGAAVPAEHAGRRWALARTNLAGLAATCRRRSSPHGSGGRGELVGASHLHGQHAASRHRFREYGTVPGSTRAAPGYAAGGICMCFAGRRAAPACRRESSPGRSAGGLIARGNYGTEKTHIHFALGAVATRAVEVARAAQSGLHARQARHAGEAGGCPTDLAIVSGGKYFVVAA